MGVSIHCDSCGLAIDCETPAKRVVVTTFGALPETPYADRFRVEITIKVRSLDKAYGAICPSCATPYIQLALRDLRA